MNEVSFVQSSKLFRMFHGECKISSSSLDIFCKYTCIMLILDSKKR